MPGDAHRDRELQRVVRPARPDQPVFGKRQAARPAPIPAAASSGRAAAVSISAMQRPPPPLDKGDGGVEPAIEIDRRDHRFKHIGQDRSGCAPRPAAASAGDSRRSAVRARSVGHPRQRLAPHELRVAAGSAAPPARRRNAATADPRPPAPAPGRRGIRAARSRAARAALGRRPRPLPACRSALGWVSASARSSGRAKAWPSSRPRQRWPARVVPGSTVVRALPVRSVDALEQPAVADRERPFPDFPPAAPNRRSRRR